VPSTRRGYAVALNRLCKDFGADSGTAGLDPDRVGGWFTFVWGGVAADVQHPPGRAARGVRLLGVALVSTENRADMT
jgi:hypothetical protein